MIPSLISQEDLFALLSVVASIIRYGTYGLSIYYKETRPHVFSWFNWGLVVSIGTYAQFQLGGGPSVWGLALVAMICFAFAIWALFVGEKGITRSDWLTLAGAFIAIVFWQLTSDPLIGLGLVNLIDILSFWPTIRKSRHDPWGEPPKSYFWAGLRYFLLLFAVPHPTRGSLLYPLGLMTTTGRLCFMFWPDANGAPSLQNHEPHQWASCFEYMPAHFRIGAKFNRR
jgi:hypothetical protein